MVAVSLKNHMSGKLAKKLPGFAPPFYIAGAIKFVVSHV